MKQSYATVTRGISPIQATLDLLKQIGEIDWQPSAAVRGQCLGSTINELTYSAARARLHGIAQPLSMLFPVEQRLWEELKFKCEQKRLGSAYTSTGDRDG